MRQQAFLSCTAVLLYACTAVAQNVPAAGCYDLDVGPWSPPSELLTDSLSVASPTRLLLRVDEPLVSAGDTRPQVLETAPGAMPGTLRTAVWRPLGGDSIVLTWSNGQPNSAGLRIGLFVDGDTLRGSASTWSDVVGREPGRAPAVATAVSCAAPLAPEAALRYRFLRGIWLPPGDSIRIDEALPDLGSQLLRRSEPGAEVLLEPAMPFAGTATTHVAIDSAGIVLRINMRYPEDVTHEELVRRLTAAIGPPQGDTSQTRRGRTGRWTTWSDRLVVIEVATPPDGSRLWVSLSGRR